MGFTVYEKLRYELFEQLLNGSQNKLNGVIEYDKAFGI